MPDIQEIYQEVKEKSLIPNLEPLEVVEEVARYKYFWKPDKINTILLAESHVFTRLENFSCEIKREYLEFENQPKQFVRYVYCPGYGENDILVQAIKTPKNSGTRQYWEIFYSCVHKVYTQADFSPIQKTRNTYLSSRIENKYQLLSEFKNLGVWLLDASLFGIYPHQEGFTNSQYYELINLCWRRKIFHEIRESHPKRLIVIGINVHKALSYLIQELPEEVPVYIQNQPQAHMTREEQLHQFHKYYELCNS